MQQRHSASREPLASATGGPLSLFEHRAFRMLWLVWLGTNACMWMHEATSGWVMTTLNPTPLMVALLQTASTAPMLLLALPAGAMADIVDRRRFLALTQFWVGAIGILLGAIVWSGELTPGVLLAGGVGIGIAMALRMPPYSALVQEIVTREALPRAILLNGIAHNASRAIGPIVAGALIASAGAHYVFVLNGLLSIVMAIVLLAWKRERAKASALPSERVVGAMRVGMQYVRESPILRAAILRATAFFLCAIAPLALMPLVVRDRLDGGPGTFSAMLACMGLGAIVYALVVGEVRKRLSRDGVLNASTIVMAVVLVAIGLARWSSLAGVAMFVYGFAWMAAVAAIQISAQLSLPQWVRGRGLAVLQMAFFGGGAFGSAIWGQVANKTGLSIALLAAAASALLTLLLALRFKLGTHGEEDLTPLPYWREPSVAMPIEGDRGPVLVTVTYDIDPATKDEFLAVMKESRQLRLRHGAISWSLFQDAANPNRYIEHFVDESWLEHQRHRDRTTAYEYDLAMRKRKFHVGKDLPEISYYLSEEVARR